MRRDPRLQAELRGHGNLLAATVGAGLVAAGAAVAQAWILARIISHVFLAGQTLHQAGFQLIALGALAGVRGVGTWGGRVAGSRLARRIKGALRDRLMERLERLGPVRLGTEHSGDLAQIAGDGIQGLEAYFARYLPQLALAALIPVLVLAVILPLDPWSALVLLLTAPLIPFFLWLISRHTERASHRRWRTLARLGARYLDLVQGLETLKLLGRSRQQGERIAAAGTQYRLATMEVLRVAFLSSLVLELVTMMSTALVAVQAGLRLLYGRLEYQQALFLLVLVPVFYLPLRQLGAHFHAAAPALAAAERLYVLLDRAPGKTGTRRAPERPARIVLDRVEYAYPDGRQALRGVSLELEDGRVLGLVGPSGSGKSTVARLLLGLMSPAAGSVRVDGVPLDELDLDQWRRRLAWVPGRPRFFHGTVADNLRLARPQATRSELEHALRGAELADVVEALPRGMDTLLGEDAARLSGGEAQRLAVARALLRDAPVVILDEPTAHLDAHTDMRVRRALRALVRGRMALLIAHRLDTVLQVGRIAVLQEGRVVEQGTPQELLSGGGPLARMNTVLRRRTGEG